MSEQAGRAWVFGNDINTDNLSPGPYHKLPLEERAPHCLESVDPDFAGGVVAGDFVVAGTNFGMGSSREQAAEVLRYLGAGAVIAKSFGGIFYRNAFNYGLMALVCGDTDRIDAGDRLAIDYDDNVILNLTKDERLAFEPVPEHLQNLVRYGGLISYLQNTKPAAE